MGEISAVLTGDLIGSTKADAETVDRAMAALAQGASTLSALSGDDTRFTRFRGDGWQIHLRRPELSLRAVLVMCARLRAANTGLGNRISIGIGAVDRLGITGLAEASGEAFHKSGRGLDSMPKSKRIVANYDSPYHEWHWAIFDLVEWISARWTREQAEAAYMMLDPLPISQKDVAASLGISRQAFQARVAGSGVTACNQAIYAFEHNGIPPSESPHA